MQSNRFTHRLIGKLFTSLFVMSLVLTMHLADANPAYSVGEVEVTLPDIALVNTQSESVSIAKVLKPSQPSLLQFMFTSCGNICPLLSASLRSVQESLAGKAELVSVSIDPEFDSPAVLEGYARQFNAAPHWQFYTGDYANIVSLQKAFGVYQGNKMRHRWITFIYDGRHWHKLQGTVSRKHLLAEFERLTALP